MIEYVKIKSGHLVQLSGKNKAGLLTGWRVGKDGNKFSKVVKGKEQVFLHIFPETDIVKKMKMNNKYATLEPLKEDTPPTNSMGASSSTPGTGAVDTFDPLMTRKNRIVRRVINNWKQVNSNGSKNNE